MNNNSFSRTYAIIFALQSLYMYAHHVSHIKPAITEFGFDVLLMHKAGTDIWP